MVKNSNHDQIKTKIFLFWTLEEFESWEQKRYLEEDEIIPEDKTVTMNNCIYISYENSHICFVLLTKKQHSLRLVCKY